jgi:hypothetical protein
MRNRIVPFLLVVLVVLASGCDLLDELGITVSPEESSFQFFIEPGEAGAYNYAQEILGSNLDSLAQAEGYDLDQVNEATLKSCVLTILAPNGANFDAFESFTATISTSSEALGTLVADVQNVVDGLTEIEFETENVDLKSFLEAENYTLYISGVQDGEVTETISIEGVINFNIKIGF